MHICFRLTSWLIFLFIITGHPTFAQEQAPEDKFLESIRAQMVTASENRNRMEKESEELKAELLSLQAEIERYKEKLAEKDQEYFDVVTPSTEQEPIAEEPSVHFDELSGDAVVEEAEQIYLSGEHMVLDELQRLQELQMYDLLLQKQELEIDYSSKEMLHRKTQEVSQSDLQALHMDIQESTEKEKELSLKITELERAIEMHPIEIENLRMENKALKEKIRKLK